jgi:hypothetical protein
LFGTHGVKNMAAKKKKKAKKASKAARAKKSPARKARKAVKTIKARKTKVAAKKAVKAAGRKSPAKKARKASVKAPAKRKRIVGEGDYAASERFRKDETSFVEKNRTKIPAMGQAAEKALEGPEGDALREAEATAAARSRDRF